MSVQSASSAAFGAYANDAYAGSFPHMAAVAVNRHHMGSNKALKR
jgi:hypothetical protein